MAAYSFMHLGIGLGFNPRVRVDHNLLRWLVDAPRGTAPYAGGGGGQLWLWKQIAASYCLAVAAAHPRAAAWARLPPGGPERREAEAADADGLIAARRWFDGLLRPGGEADGDTDVDDAAERMAGWPTAEAFVDKLEWFDTDEGRKLATRVWRDAMHQPYGLVSLF